MATASENINNTFQQVGSDVKTLKKFLLSSKINEGQRITIGVSSVVIPFPNLFYQEDASVLEIDKDKFEFATPFHDGLVTVSCSLSYQLANFDGILEIWKDDVLIQSCILPKGGETSESASITSIPFLIGKDSRIFFKAKSTDTKSPEDLTLIFGHYNIEFNHKIQPK